MAEDKTFNQPMTIAGQVKKPVAKNISQMTKEEIDAFTARQIAAGGKSIGVGIGAENTVRLPGETFSQANARITAGYKEMLARPVPSAEQTAAGMKVQYVRTEAGGVGSYTTVVQPGYAGDRTVRDWTAGIIPSNSPYIYGSTLGVMSTGEGTYTQVGGVIPKTKVKGSSSYVTSDKGPAVSTKDNGDGTVTYTYADGTTKTVFLPSSANNKTGVYPVAVTTNPDGTKTVHYSDGTSKTVPGSGVDPDVIGGNNVGGNNFSGTSSPSTNVEVLKSLLRGSGYNAKLVDASASYLQQLLKEGIDYDNAVEIFLNSKEYTLKNGSKITSPFYTEYGYLNENAPRPLGASELYGFVEGAREIVTRYNLNTKFVSPESLKKYIANRVTVENLEARANTARLKAIESDAAYVAGLQRLGFIGSAADLTDFYMDEKIGQETLEQNQRMGIFAAENIRRANAGLVFGEAQKALAKQFAATTQLRGEDVTKLAAAGYANIAETLKPLTSLSGIYERAGIGAQRQDILQGQIQSELEQEEFLGTESARRRRLLEQNVRAFEAGSGTTTYSLRGGGISGVL